MTLLLLLATCFLAYSNGANDNFKGVASLFGSRTCSYRIAISYGTLTTFAGSLAAIFLAQELARRFSGKGLVPEGFMANPWFLLAVAAGAGGTVLLATCIGFPISTTHGLTGALVGAGLAAGGPVRLNALGKDFVLPLLVSPALAVAVGALIYLVFRWLRLHLGVTKEMCICAGIEPEVVALPQAESVFAAQAMPQISVMAGSSAVCTQRYAGRLLGLNAGRLLDTAHFLSAGAVSFARGLNDTPKIAALLLIAAGVNVHWGMVVTALAIALGGLLSARNVAETMSHKIADMNPGQGFAANLSTALLVTTASLHGLPVSTTHVSVGALLGMGITARQAKWGPVRNVLASWVLTLPCAGLIAAAAYGLKRLSY